MAVYVAPGLAGTGVFVDRAYARGEVVLDIHGPIHSGAELDVIGFRPGYPLQIELDQYMVVVEPFVFCNHCCDPNGGITPDLKLVAVRDIAAGEEVCFDYSSTMLEDNSWTMECGCKTAKCRGKVEDFDRLPAEAQRYLLEHVGVMPFIVRALGLKAGAAT
jgi:hypothetical protein